MKQPLAAVLALVTLGFVGAPAATTVRAAQAPGPVAQSLMDMEHEWAKASKAANVEALAPMLSDAFVGLDSDGTVRTKVEWLARTKTAKWTTNELGDMKVTLHGDTAIVTGSWIGKGTDGTGRAINAKERWADTWIKSGGKWQCVASASAPAR